jgi:tetratricopeptide (TPR) repeat protein
VSNLYIFSQIVTGHVELVPHDQDHRYFSEASHCAATRASFPHALALQTYPPRRTLYKSSQTMMTDDTQPPVFASGRPASADSCDELAKGLFNRFMESGDMAVLDEALLLEREALRLRPEGHPDRAGSCASLAYMLTFRFDRAEGTALLDEAIEVEREALRLRPEGHPDRAISCINLGQMLRTHFDRTGRTALLDEALELEREALRLTPEGHPHRAHSCRTLAATLMTRFDQTGHTTLLDEALKLDREVLRLTPEGHPHRAHSCDDLATTLNTRFHQTGHTALLDEALELGRDALRLRPEGHPDRALSCANLAAMLGTCFDQTGHTALLDEALELERESLRLRPKGHPDRAHSCGSLATTLKALFHQTGQTALLDEALELEREALRLRPEGHPKRATSCINLASMVRTRFYQTGHTALLDEALELEREALRLTPEGHPIRAYSCGNLATTLKTRFHETRHTALLDEALELDREALRLTPEGLPIRANTCGNLAATLKTRFNQTGHTALLDEALELEREALRLRPEGHPDRARSCANLAITLRARFEQTRHTALLDEARLHCTHAIKESAKSPEDHVILRVQLALIFSRPTYPSGNPSTAVAFLLELIQYRAGMIPAFYDINDTLRLCVKVAVTDEDHARLLAVYQVVIEVLPEMGSAVLTKLSRLRRWSKAGNLPQEAFLQALKVKDLAKGLELLEHGRAVLWSQTLALQGTHLQGLTDERKIQVQTLLQSISAVVEHGDTPHSDFTERDRTHAVYNRFQQLLTEIRASPGLERFMRGPSYSELLHVASANPVIIVAATDAACHALIITSPSAAPIHLVLNKIAISDLELLGDDIRGLDSNVRASSGFSVATEERGIKSSGNGRRMDSAVRKLHQALRRLWVDMVKPILDRLSLEVCGVTPNPLRF